MGWTLVSVSTRSRKRGRQQEGKRAFCEKWAQDVGFYAVEGVGKKFGWS